jgi:hypothetical protein
MRGLLAITGIFALWFILDWLTEVTKPYHTAIGIGLVAVIFLTIVKIVNAVLK